MRRAESRLKKLEAHTGLTAGSVSDLDHGLSSAILKTDDIVAMDNLASHKVCGA